MLDILINHYTEPKKTYIQQEVLSGVKEYHNASW